MGFLKKLLGGGGSKPHETEVNIQDEVERETIPELSEAFDPAAHAIELPEFEALRASGEPIEILDVREIWEFSGGAIPGSKNCPLSELGIMLRDLDPAREYITVCAMGMRSMQAAYILSSHGFERVRSLEGGYMGWSKAQ